MGHDVVVIGGGPAGSVTARALAQLGYAVVLLHDEPRGRTPEVESLPPSAAPLVIQLGLGDVVLGASVARMPGNTVLWAGAPAVDTTLPEPGHQVARTQLDPLLRFAALAAGVEVREGVRAVSIEETPERVVVTTRDAGRRGTLVEAAAVVIALGRGALPGARARRVKPRGWRTLAVCGAWADVPALSAPRDASTWIESGDDGWAWTVPLGPRARQVTVMIDPPSGGAVDGGVEGLYRRALAGLPGTARAIEGGRLTWVRATDSSASIVTPATTPRTIRIGDACTTVDPIASFGIKKALGAARLAAAVVNTSLRRPRAIADTARATYAEAEAREFAGSMAGAAAEAQRAAAFHGSAFWTRRTFKSARTRDPLPAAEVTPVALDGSALTLAPGVRIETRAVLEGWLFEERPALVSARWPEGLRYLGGVDVCAAIEAAAGSAGIPETIAERYRRLSGREVHPDALAAALGHLLATGALTRR